MIRWWFPLVLTTMGNLVVEEHKIPMTEQYVAGCRTDIVHVYNKVVEVAKNARECYEEGSTREFNEEAFTRMMFLDGCFILQFVFCMAKQKYENMKMKSHTRAFVQRDMFLLENQLPFQVLEALMSLRFKESEGKEIINTFITQTRAEFPHADTSCKEKLCKYISSKVCGSEAQPESNETEFKDQLVQQIEIKDQPVHLLEIVREKLIGDTALEDAKSSSRSDCCSYLGKLIKNYSTYFCAKLIGKNAKGDGQSSSSSDWCSYRSAKELKSVGIHFKPGETHLLTGVRFESTFLGGQLTLPSITVDDSTKSLLLNLVAYETCPDAPDDFGVTSYVCLMDTLIDHAEDVMMLRSKGVLLNLLGSDQQVADLFNGIANDLVPNPNTYADVKERMERHYRNKLNIWTAEWLHTHFRSPWAILAFVAAIFAISLSCLQTYYAANPPKSS